VPVFETFSKRQKRLRGELPDVYVYDQLSQPLRVQIIHVMHEVLGEQRDCTDGYRSYTSVHWLYRDVVKVLRKELGVFRLPHTDTYEGELVSELGQFILKSPDTDDVLSAVELVCRGIEHVASEENDRNNPHAPEIAKDAIVEINARFREHGVGYEYDGEIVRIDSELLHAEAVKPALALLRDPLFKGAEDEFLQAYAHYRKGDHKEAMNEALKSFESTMKVVLQKRGWAFDPTDPAAKLIKACFDNGLVSAFWQSHFNALKSTLEASVPTGRNKLSGHGQGATLTTVPDYLAGYVLHMTASAIVFLVRAEKALL